MDTWLVIKPTFNYRPLCCSMSYPLSEKAHLSINKLYCRLKSWSPKQRCSHSFCSMFFQQLQQLYWIWLHVWKHVVTTPHTEALLYLKRPDLTQSHCRCKCIVIRALLLVRPNVAWNFKHLICIGVKRVETFLFTFRTFQPGHRRRRWPRCSRDDVRFCRGSQSRVCFFLNRRLHSLGVHHRGAALALRVRPGWVCVEIWEGSCWKRKTQNQNKWVRVKGETSAETEANQSVFIPFTTRPVKYFRVGDVNFRHRCIKCAGWSPWRLGGYSFLLEIAHFNNSR